MPTRTQPVRTHNPAHQRRGAIAPAVPYTPPHGLILPAIEAPAETIFHTGGDGVRKFAAALAMNGILQREHLTGRGLPQAVKLSLQQFSDQFEDKLRLWQNFFCLGIDNKFELSQYNLDPDRKNDKACFCVSTIDYISVYTIGEVLSDIQERQPGMGGKLLDLINMASAQSFGTFLPSDTLELVQISSWGGESDERERRYELDWEAKNHNKQYPKEKPWSADEMLAEYGIPTRAEFDRLIPTWATERPLKQLFGKDPKIPTVTVEGEPEMTFLCRRLQGLLREIFKAHGKEARINDRARIESTDPCITSIICRWSKDDTITQHIWDEQMQANASGGDIITDLVGIYFFDLENPVSFANAIKRLSWSMEIAFLLDALLCLLITEPKPSQRAFKNRPLIDIFGVAEEEHRVAIAFENP